VALHCRSIDESMELLEPELEHQVDQMILRVPDLEMRAALLAQRERILREFRQKTLIANLRYRLAEAEARLRPTLVQGGDR
jgi:hypothetical protein